MRRRTTFDRFTGKINFFFEPPQLSVISSERLEFVEAQSK
jgi:hypothetical protein